MKRLFVLLATVALAFSLSACATTSGGDAATMKCPACGHEFDYEP